MRADESVRADWRAVSPGKGRSRKGRSQKGRTCRSDSFALNVPGDVGRGSETLMARPVQALRHSRPGLAPAASAGRVPAGRIPATAADGRRFYDTRWCSGALSDRTESSVRRNRSGFEGLSTPLVRIGPIRTGCTRRGLRPPSVPSRPWRRRPSGASRSRKRSWWPAPGIPSPGPTGPRTACARRRSEARWPRRPTWPR